ncbi:MAG: choice-of-anchor C family protein [Proteobacteria bacterium]|nr:choice-of-anchor C family protein [Pseudomonadota bacterium]
MKFVNKAIISVALAASACGLVHAAPFQNGSFEIGPVNPGTFVTLNGGDTSIAGWTVTGNSIDYINTYWQHADGARSLDLSGDAAGGIQQAFDTVAGHSYRVSFAMAGNGGGGNTIKSMQVQATGGALTTYTFDTTGHTYANMGWATQTYAFIAAGAASTLSFTSLENNAAGPALDNVVVADVTPVPTPTLSLWTLIGLASLLGVFAARRARFG